jgi:hypothetical protein
MFIKFSGSPLLLVAAGFLGGLLGLSFVRLLQSLQNGYEEGIVRGQIACGVVGIAFAVVMILIWRRR